MSKELGKGSEKQIEKLIDLDFNPNVSRANYESWFPELPSEIVEKVLTYQGELNKFNKTVNLVSSHTLKYADVVHFADSIFASALIAPNLISNAPLYDFGSGNGFPGLIFALLNSGINVVLVDKDDRKLEFCDHVTSVLNLKNVTALKSDVEAFEPSTLKNVIARGFASLSRSVMIARRTMAPGGRFFHLKGDNWATEIAAIPPQLLSMWTPSLLGRYSLPDSRGEMAIVLTEKSL